MPPQTSSQRHQEKGQGLYSWPWNWLSLGPEKSFLNTLRCHETWLAGKSPSQMDWWHRRVNGHHPVDRNLGALANVTTRQRCSSIGVYGSMGMGTSRNGNGHYLDFFMKRFQSPTDWVVQWKRMTPNSQPTSKLVSNFLIYCLVVRNGPATCWFANQPCRGRRFRSRQQSHPAFAGPPNKQTSTRLEDSSNQAWANFMK